MTDSASGETEIGPQYEKDPPFAARMRFHQSWYRANALGVRWGTGPTPNSPREIGSMLAREDGAKGLNFVSAVAFEAAKRRLASATGLVEEYRLLHNMLSSQPMCFNVFAPLAADLGLASLVFAALFPGVVGKVARIAFEYAPEPASDYLGDRTAFDCFVEYDTPDRGCGFVGIETKLTEPFSKRHYDGPSYRRWVERSDSPWPTETWARLDEVRHNQLWRDHLLAVAMLAREGSAYASGRLMLVCHPADEECEATVNSYSGLLKPGDSTFSDCPLDGMVAAIEASAIDSVHRAWIAEFKRRYLDLTLSEEAWRNPGVA